jgi:hypothetical protein
MVIFVAFFLEISAGFFFLRGHLLAKSHTLVAYFGLADLGILKKNSQDAKNGSSSCQRIIFHFAGCLWRFVFCKYPELKFVYEGAPGSLNPSTPRPTSSAMYFFSF